MLRQETIPEKELRTRMGFLLREVLTYTNLPKAENNKVLKELTNEALKIFHLAFGENITSLVFGEKSKEYSESMTKGQLELLLAIQTIGVINNLKEKNKFEELVKDQKIDIGPAVKILEQVMVNALYEMKRSRTLKSADEVERKLNEFVDKYLTVYGGRLDLRQENTQRVFIPVFKDKQNDDIYRNAYNSNEGDPTKQDKVIIDKLLELYQKEFVKEPKPSVSEKEEVKPARSQ